LSGKADAREAHLSSLFGALIEGVTDAKRLRGEPLFAEDPYTSEGPRNRIDELDRQAKQVSEWLHGMSGLVEPEPSMQRSCNVRRILRTIGVQGF